MKTKNQYISFVELTIIILTFFISGSVKAQVGSTLQFNQILFLSATSDNSGAQWTVPSGHVWKIEMMGTQNNNDGGFVVYFNSVRAFYVTGGYYSSSYSGPSYRYSNASGIIWLPEGTTLGTTCSSSTHHRWFSIIEYKVLP